MAGRSALVRCDDAAVTDSVVRRLTADGLRVTVVPPTADPDGAVADAAASGVLHTLVCAVGQPPRRRSPARIRRGGTPT
ncbi:hypothetical protein [Geodermatophilus sp. SYSU D01176]